MREQQSQELRKSNISEIAKKSINHKITIMNLKWIVPNIVDRE